MNDDEEKGISNLPLGGDVSFNEQQDSVVSPLSSASSVVATDKNNTTASVIEKSKRKSGEALLSESEDLSPLKSLPTWKEWNLKNLEALGIVLPILQLARNGDFENTLAYGKRGDWLKTITPKLFDKGGALSRYKLQSNMQRRFSSLLDQAREEWTKFHSDDSSGEQGETYTNGNHPCIKIMHEYFAYQDSNPKTNKGKSNKRKAEQAVLKPIPSLGSKPVYLTESQRDNVKKGLARERPDEVKEKNSNMNVGPLKFTKATNQKRRSQYDPSNYSLEAVLQSNGTFFPEADLYDSPLFSGCAEYNHQSVAQVTPAKQCNSVTTSEDHVDINLVMELTDKVCNLVDKLDRMKKSSSTNHQKAVRAIETSIEIVNAELDNLNSKRLLRKNKLVNNEVNSRHSKKNSRIHSVME